MLWNFSKYQTNTALLDDKGNSLSYIELQQANDELAQVVGGRCLVFSLCSNTLGSVMGYTAFVNNNIVPVLLNTHLEQTLLKKLMDLYCPAFVWLPNEMLGQYDHLSKVYSAYGYSLLKTAYNKNYPLYSQLGLLLTTSGSTGNPKFVRQSYNNILVNAQQIVEYLHLNQDERPVTTLPMNYTYGCSIINSHLLVGATILLTDKSIMLKDFWQFMKENRATSFGGVPYTYEMLNKLRFFRMELPYLKTMTQSGGKLALELHKKFAEYAQANNKQFVVMYGSCEATSRMGYLPCEKALEKCGSFGQAIPGGRFYLVDENNIIIKEHNIIGELVYEGSNVTLGYAENSYDLAKGDEFRGVLYTGDMAKRDEDGYYYIVGRKKRFLKLYGNRVNLDDIEQMIKARFGYLDCASAGVDDHMYIFVTNDKLIDTVKKYVAEFTKINTAAFNVVCLDKIPKNETGKILYKELTKYYM